MVGELTERLFQGNAAALMSHLLAEHDLGARELAQIQELVARHDKEDD